jgi:hypothetical protein
MSTKKKDTEPAVFFYITLETILFIPLTVLLPLLDTNSAMRSQCTPWRCLRDFKTNIIEYMRKN